MVYNDDIIRFFKKHNLYDKEMFDYLLTKTDMIDYQDEDLRICIGCAFKIDKKTGKLKGFRICIPYCDDEKTKLMSVHEIAHGIWAYKNLNKRINEIELELFPMLLEKIYYLEHRSKELTDYISFLDSTIDETSDERYRFALRNRDNLIDCQVDGFRTIDKTTKKLVRKWRRDNR